MKKLIFLFFITSALLSCNSKKETEAGNDSENKTEITTNNEVQSSEQEENQFLVNETKNECEIFYLSLLNSSKTYQKNIEGLDKSIKQNGGIGLKVALKKDNSLVTYTILETYADKNTVIDTYFFNTKTQQLYEEEYVGAEPKMLDFDKKLISHKNLHCNL